MFEVSLAFLMAADGSPSKHRDVCLCPAVDDVRWELRRSDL